jgi:ZIP family zinc transporter
MGDYLQVLALALLPGAGNAVGGLLSELVRVSGRAVSVALHAAAGIVLGVIAVELVPRAIAAAHPWITIACLFAGGLFFVGVDATLDLVRVRWGKAEAGSAWAIFFGVAVDLFTDGVMIGTGATLSFGLAALLALGQVAADVPEGFATIAVFRRQGLTRRRRLLLSASFTLPLLAGATAGYWLLRDAPDLPRLALLAFTAGVLLTVTVEEMVVEAHRESDGRLEALALAGGFALFALAGTYLDR